VFELMLKLVLELVISVAIKATPMIEDVELVVLVLF
jgi:hypothetical protein